MIIDVKTFEVQFDKIADVKNFVAMAEKLKGSISITSRENYVCNGKSIMGIFGLNLSSPVEVTCEEKDFDNVYDFCDSAGILVG